MNRLFGSRQTANKPSLQSAITSTEQRAEGVEVKLRKLDGELARYRDQLNKMRDGPGKQAVQRRAMGVLKQKRMYEAQLTQLQQQAFNMEQATMTTDNLRNTMATVDAMKTANKEMKRAYGKVDVAQIERLQDEMEDLMDSANEVQETLGRTYGVPDEIDEDDLAAELDALENDLEAEELETPSYLQDTNPALPDFVDEPPVLEAPGHAQQKEAAV